MTKHNHNFIQKYMQNKKQNYGFSQELELKGRLEIGQQFYERMSKDIRFEIVNNNIIGIAIEGYFKDSLENYSQAIALLLGRFGEYLQQYKQEILVFADNVNLGNTKDTQNAITQYLQKELKNTNIKFVFGNSKNFLGIQLADIFTYQMRNHILNDEVLDDFVIQNIFNMNISQIYTLKKVQ